MSPLARTHTNPGKTAAIALTSGWERRAHRRCGWPGAQRQGDRHQRTRDPTWDWARRVEPFEHNPPQDAGAQSKEALQGQVSALIDPTHSLLGAVRQWVGRVQERVRMRAQAHRSRASPKASRPPAGSDAWDSPSRHRLGRRPHRHRQCPRTAPPLWTDVLRRATVDRPSKVLWRAPTAMRRPFGAGPASLRIQQTGGSRHDAHRLVPAATTRTA